MDEIPFGRQMKQRRRDLDLTQEALAEQVGCSVDTIRKLEAGGLRPSRQLAALLATHLAIPPDEQPTWIARARSGAEREAGPACDSEGVVSTGVSSRGSWRRTRSPGRRAPATSRSAAPA